MIKLYETDEINNYLELDPNLFNENSDSIYKDNHIYILHFPKEGNISVSYQIGIEKINDYDIKYKCNTDYGSSGSPILNLSTNKVIGIHKAFERKQTDSFNIGTLLKYPLNELELNKEPVSLNSLLSSNIVNSYINSGPNCNANSIAIIICLASARVYGRKRLDYFNVRKKIIDIYGNNLVDTFDFLNKYLIEYKLHYREVDEEGARKAILKSRPCLAIFNLTGKQWDNFRRFYNHNKKGILTEEILTKNNNFKNVSDEGSSSVVLTHVSDNCLTFLKSGDINFADNGYFRVKNADVLDVKFIDIFWYISDLSKEEVDAFNNYKQNH